MGRLLCQLQCSPQQQQSKRMASSCVCAISFFMLPAFSFLFLFFVIPLAAEKTLCERKLAEVPANTFYYQRTEVGGLEQCAQRCVEDWQFCRSALLVQEGGKSLCQLYGISFERRLPLEVPSLTPAQADPERLLPITLVELSDPPCSSKFTGRSSLLNQLDSATRNLLGLLSSSSRKEFPRFELREKKEEETQENGPVEEDSADQSYSTPPTAIGLNRLSEDDNRPNFAQGLASGPQMPEPIRPAYISHGRDPNSARGSRCQNGVCPNAAVTAFHSSLDNSPAGPGTPCAARKTTDPCAPQPQWLDWEPGSCSVTCGKGVRERRRYCSSGRQEDCKGLDKDSERCVMPECNQWGDWSEWSRCSTSCGGGRASRQRVCRNGDHCEGQSVESRGCAEQPCPAWSHWGEWSQCSASCGQGSQRRTRECVPNEAYCAGRAVEHRSCELRACPEWTEWGAWSSCSKSCDGGESVRHRECQNGRKTGDCRGPAGQHLLCNTQPCPAWTPWAEWSACSKSCGEGGIRTRRRECHYNGFQSRDCTGPAQDQAECGLDPCPSWADWSPWSQCSASCGHGRQTRSRECRPTGVGCAGGEREVRFCQNAVCPYFDQWTDWGGCSVTCGIGFCERRRRCIKDGDLDGSRGPAAEPAGAIPLREEEDDKEESVGNESGLANGIATEQPSAAEDIAAADSLRAHTLQVAQSAVATQLRRSPQNGKVKVPLMDAEWDQGGAGECVGPETERKPCDAGPCCEWAQWNGWSDCRVRCGRSDGFRERTRSCELQHQPGNEIHNQLQARPQFPFVNGGCPVCVGESRQTESCAHPPRGLCDESGPSGGEQRAKPSKLTTDYGDGAAGKDGRVMRDQQKKKQGEEGTGEEVAETSEEDSCFWSEWTAWSECEEQSLVRNRTRMCAGLRALVKDCRCNGPAMEQMNCALASTVNAAELRMASSSLVKRVQLTPRHRPSMAERRREEGHHLGPEETVLRRDQPEECAEWMDWAEWGQCGGKCGAEGMRSRTRECKCQKGCAGISRESVSCAVADCQPAAQEEGQ